MVDDGGDEDAWRKILEGKGKGLEAVEEYERMEIAYVNEWAWEHKAWLAFVGWQPGLPDGVPF